MFAALDRVAHGILRSIGAKSHFVDTTVGRVHAYRVRGKGRGTFVLVHGMGTASTAYIGVVRRLKQRAGEIVLLDLPGHGKSEMPVGGLDRDKLAVGVREALDAIIPPEKAVILGTSLGGAAALGYALERPERVRALVLASPAGAPVSKEDLVALRARFDLKTREDARRFFGELMHAPPFYTRILEKGLVSQLGRPVVRGFLGSVGAKDVFEREVVAQLEPPTTVLWGKSDRILPRSGLDFYRSALPAGTRFEELDEVGHSPHVEKPGLVADRLIEAFDRADRV